AGFLNEPVFSRGFKNIALPIFACFSCFRVLKKGQKSSSVERSASIALLFLGGTRASNPSARAGQDPGGDRPSVWQQRVRNAFAQTVPLRTANVRPSLFGVSGPIGSRSRLVKELVPCGIPNNCRNDLLVALS